MKQKNSNKDVILLKKDQGRKYTGGPITAVFKADEHETDHQYSVSEWRLDPNAEGPGAHMHESVELFYVLEGKPSFFIGDAWIEASKGTFIRIPGNTMHTFTNRTGKKTGILNIKIPGGFERNVPSIMKWFEENT